ncbi:MAG: AMP-binding protein [Planctomycetota bacterium]
MKRAIQLVVAGVFRLLLLLRYRTRITGLAELNDRRGILFVASHPALIDPVIVLSHLWPQFQPRPMLFESWFHSRWISWLPGLMKALPIPDSGELDRSPQAQTELKNRSEQAVRTISAGLGSGENFILWPSGRIRRGRHEVLGGSRSTSDILREQPDLKIVLLRTRGLSGSSFSCARSSELPSLLAIFRQGFFTALKNLVLFTPRRDVEIQLEEVQVSELPGIKREVLNPYLERQLDGSTLEPGTHVPYHFWDGLLGTGEPRHEFEPAPLETLDAESLTGIAENLRDGVADAIQELRPELPRERCLAPHATLDSLGLDSLDRTELVLALEQRFSHRSTGTPTTVGALWLLADGREQSKDVAPPPPDGWNRPRRRSGAVQLEGATLPEALWNAARRGPGDFAVADDLSGGLTYERFLVAVQLFADRLRAQTQSEHIGILLPATAAVDLLIFAVHAAGRTPVILNWTTGPKNLHHAVDVMEIEHVVTSKAFVSRIETGDLGANFLFLEDVRQSIGSLQKIRTLLRTKWFPGAVRRRFAERDPHDPAVILFTSGSEKAPKAVPLTHHNILSNLRGVLGSYEVESNDVMLGFLPPFHSFGFTLTVMLPLLCGCRAVHHPDPTDANAIAKKLTAYGATILCATPTFLGYLLQQATPEDLKTLRWAVVGGEKCPEALFEKFRAMVPHGHLLEGYGVTECAPLVSCTRPGMAEGGTMGKPLLGVTTRVVDPDSLESVSTGEPGMLLVGGPSVFPGYLDYDGPSPFVEIEGERYYVTKDLVVDDQNGTRHFAGRLMRFLKSGGEMVSLPAIEAPLTREFPPDDQGPQLAVEGIESPRRIVLFTRAELDTAEANRIVHDAGLRGVLRVDEVIRLDAIPVLGTGKIDYKVLKHRLERGA